MAKLKRVEGFIPAHIIQITAGYWFSSMEEIVREIRSMTAEVIDPRVEIKVEQVGLSFIIEQFFIYEDHYLRNPIDIMQIISKEHLQRAVMAGCVRFAHSMAEKLFFRDDRPKDW